MSEAPVWRTIDEEAGVWSLTYPSSEPPGEESADQAAPANCIVMRVGQSQLAVLSPATDMTDAAFMELEKHGRPVALIAPSGSHHLGQPRWQARYSQARCFAPKGARCF